MPDWTRAKLEELVEMVRRGRLDRTFQEVVRRRYILPYQDSDGLEVHAVCVDGTLFVSNEAWRALERAGLLQRRDVP